LLDLRGDCQVEVLAVEDLNRVHGMRIRISPRKIHTSNELLRHKTTDRLLYDEELEKVRIDGFIEVLFENTDGYITEGAFTNIFLLLPDGWKTPPVTSGLLPGIWREMFLSEKSAMEVPLTPADLKAASRIIIGNSVRGAVEIDEIVDPEGQLVFSRETGDQ
jgi:para-aminobenzoate synthetase/4-amino-4-deoxychorismate lyase